MLVGRMLRKSINVSIILLGGDKKLTPERGSSLGKSFCKSDTGCLSQTHSGCEVSLGRGIGLYYNTYDFQL
jgi:hypothetical protein